MKENDTLPIRFKDINKIVVQTINQGFHLVEYLMLIDSMKTLCEAERKRADKIVKVMGEIIWELSENK